MVWKKIPECYIFVPDEKDCDISVYRIPGDPCVLRRCRCQSGNLLLWGLPDGGCHSLAGKQMLRDAWTGPVCKSRWLLLRCRVRQFRLECLSRSFVQFAACGNRFDFAYLFTSITCSCPFYKRSGRNRAGISSRIRCRNLPFFFDSPFDLVLAGVSLYVGSPLPVFATGLHC